MLVGLAGKSRCRLGYIAEQPRRVPPAWDNAGVNERYPRPFAEVVTNLQSTITRGLVALML